MRVTGETGSAGGALATVCRSIELKGGVAVPICFFCARDCGGTCTGRKADQKRPDAPRQSCPRCGFEVYGAAFRTCRACSLIGCTYCMPTGNTNAAYCQECVHSSSLLGLLSLYFGRLGYRTDEALTFDVPGPPHGEPRKRVRGVTVNGKCTATTYPHPKAAEWRDAVKAAALERAGFGAKLGGPAVVALTAWCQLPKGEYRKLEPRQAEPIVLTPDCDNVLKLYKDALEGIAYGNDNQAVAVWCDRWRCAQTWNRPGVRASVLRLVSLR